MAYGFNEDMSKYKIAEINMTDLVVTQDVNSGENTIIDAGKRFLTNSRIEKDGYTAIGIVGVRPEAKSGDIGMIGINRFLISGALAAVELYNHGTQPVQLAKVTIKVLYVKA